MTTMSHLLILVLVVAWRRQMKQMKSIELHLDEDGNMIKENGLDLEEV